MPATMLYPNVNCCWLVSPHHRTSVAPGTVSSLYGMTSVVLFEKRAGRPSIVRASAPWISGPSTARRAVQPVFGAYGHRGAISNRRATVPAARDHVVLQE